MPSNTTGIATKRLFAINPDKVALMLNPDRLGPHSFRYRYAIDNGAFTRFQESKFFKMLNASTEYDPPMFVVCPDVVGCHDRTLALWYHYKPLIRPYGYPIAFVAQDGCTPETIPASADWIFVGGKDPWKEENIHHFVGLGKPVHVGRVNTMKRLKYCESLGVDSVDGTGWMKFRDKRHYDMIDWVTGESKQLNMFGGQNENNNAEIQV